MDSIIPLGQKNTLVEYMILSGADNRPPMLDKDLYDSWKSRMELYMQNREHGRMILESVENGPLIWHTVEENGERVLPLEWSKFVTDVKLMKDFHTNNFDQIHAYIEQHELHANEVRLLRERNQDPLVFVANQRRSNCLSQQGNGFSNNYSFFKGRQGQSYSGTGIRVMLLALGETMQGDKQGLLNATTVKVKDIWLGNALSLSNQGMQHDLGVPDGQAVQTIIPNIVAFQTEDLDTYDSNCDDISNAQAVLMANISNYGSDVVSEVPNSETYLNDIENQSVHAMQDFEQTPAVDVTDNEITSDSNIIPYSQYL
ncbi:hypothetical protein Tco_0525505 [Tanacetum coccineum]